MMTGDEITRHFISMNVPLLNTTNKLIISFSHFMPRIDIMPDFIPLFQRRLYPVLGSSLLEQQIRKLGSHIHVYGHSHVNRFIEKDGVTYINNAFGYPYETAITAKKLLCIYED
jgi:Icc-related predicted phosphoesterase